MNEKPPANTTSKDVGAEALELIRDIKAVFAGEAVPHWSLNYETTLLRCAWLDRIDRVLMNGERGAHETKREPRASDWKCTHCGRDNDPAETHCVHCEWSRMHTIAGVKHERWCQDAPCRCSAVKATALEQTDAPDDGAMRGASPQPTKRGAHTLCRYPDDCRAKPDGYCAACHESATP